MTATLLSALCAYLLGSIPFGYIIGLAHGVDIREKGSGNIGATNVFRVLGKKPGIFVFLLDMMKGLAAVRVIPQGVAMALGGAARPAAANAAEAALAAAPQPAIAAILLCAACVFLGHMFPLFLGFKGGKGVATGLGLAIGIAPHSALAAFALWIVLFAAFRYVSVASIAAALFVGVAAWFLDNSATPPNIAPAVISLLALLIIIKHKSNIKRLIAGNENRFDFSRKK
jgi:acyl-phosphate glycerol 3-phosphate acyltransferase